MQNTSSYQRILVALDFSPESAAVIERACQIAQLNGAQVQLLHVVEYVPLDLSNDLMLAQPPGLDEQLVEEARDSLTKLAASHGIENAPRQVTTGSTKHEILRVAEELPADLIVVGSHGRHGLALLLGSTANAILHGAKCDVLAVRIGQKINPSQKSREPEQE